MVTDLETSQVPVLSETLKLNLIKWCRGADSNRRHMDFQSIALPTELPRHWHPLTVLSRPVRSTARESIVAAAWYVGKRTYDEPESVRLIPCHVCVDLGIVGGAHCYNFASLTYVCLLTLTGAGVV